MPSFLDFVFPFGKQETAQDFYYASLRDDNNISQNSKAIEIPELNRSGSEVRTCYNLRSVEQSEGQAGLPWSIRQSAIYHSFDVITGQSVWINVKGNKLIKNRILEAAASDTLSKIQSRSAAFSATFAVHLLMCDWAVENWRWYINDLETELGRLTATPLATLEDKVAGTSSTPRKSSNIESGYGIPISPFDRKAEQLAQSPRTVSNYASPGFLSRGTTLADQDISESTASSCWGNTKIPNEKGTRSWIERLPIAINEKFKTMRSSQWQPWKQTFSGPSIRQNPSVLETTYLEERRAPPELPPRFTESVCERTDNDFTFVDSQRITTLEEKVQEVLLVLKLNVDVMGDLRDLYSGITDLPGFPIDLRMECQADIKRFNSRVLRAEKDIHMLQFRTKTFLCLIASRKELVCLKTF